MFEIPTWDFTIIKYFHTYIFMLNNTTILKFVITLDRGIKANIRIRLT